MKKSIKRWAISVMSVILLTAFGGTVNASAATVVVDTETLFVSGYEVTNETITPGSEFTLTVHLHNYSATATSAASYVVVNNPAGVIPEYGTISEASVGRVRPGEDISVSFNYSAEATIETNYLDFIVEIIAGTAYSSSDLRIPVGRITDFSAENVLVPKTYGVNQADYVSAKITNLGMTGVSNVIMVARSDGKDIASTRIGTMVAGTNKTEALNITFTEEGEHLLDFVLTYTNSDGEEKEYVISSTTVRVNAEIESSTTLEDITNENANIEVEDNQGGIAIDTIILICICGFLLIAVCCVVLILIYRRK